MFSGFWKNTLRGLLTLSQLFSSYLFVKVSKCQLQHQRANRGVEFLCPVIGEIAPQFRNPNKKTFGVYIISLCRPVWGPCLPLLRYFTLSSFASDPCALSCALSEPLWSWSRSVFRPPVPVDLQSSAPATFSRKAFHSDSIPLGCVFVWLRCVSHSLWESG